VLNGSGGTEQGGTFVEEGGSPTTGTTGGAASPAGGSNDGGADGTAGEATTGATAGASAGGSGTAGTSAAAGQSSGGTTSVGGGTNSTGGLTGLTGGVGGAGTAGSGGTSATGGAGGTGSVPAGCSLVAGYVVCPTGATNDVATATCASIGMRLIRIDSAAENAWLASVLTNNSWIGASDAAVEGEWRWADGTLFWLGTSTGSAQNGLYSAWTFRSPSSNPAGEDCAKLVSSVQTWNAILCSTPLGFACEAY
jgi:hypothetical protein